MCRSVRLVSAVLVLSFLSFQAQARLRDSISASEAQARLSRLIHTPWSPQTQVEENPVSESWTCAQSEVSIEVADVQNKTTERIKFRLVVPKGIEGPFPAVLIIPTIEGVSPLEPALATNFCENDIIGVIADVNEVELREIPGWGVEDVNNIRAVHRLQSIVDFLQNDHRVQRDRISTVGLSLGGITAGMFAAVEKRLSGVVITVGGGNLPAILTESDAKKVIGPREERMRKTGISNATDYEEQLHKTIQIDPIYFADQVGVQRTLMVIADADSKVPTKHQWALHTAIGQPEKIVYNTSHLWTLVDVVFHSYDRLIDFLKKGWNIPVQQWDLKLASARPFPGFLLSLY